MSLGCLRLVLCHAARAVPHPVYSTSPASLLLPPKPPPCRPLSGYLGVALQQWSRFCTAAGVGGGVGGGVGEAGGEAGGEGAEESKPKNKKKHNPNARTTIGSVGRKIQGLHVQLLDEDGGNLGVVHQAKALRMMDHSGLKLVAVNENSNPPVYRLMSGKQIHEEQLKLKEKQKNKTTGSVQMKELNLFSGIAQHDLDIKLKQTVSWLEKKHHIRLTLKRARGYSSETTLDKVLEQIVEQISVPVGFVLTSRLINEGQAATCILRPPSAKELKAAQQGTQKPTKLPRPEPGTTGNAASASEPDPPKDSEQQ